MKPAIERIDLHRRTGPVAGAGAGTAVGRGLPEAEGGGGHAGVPDRVSRRQRHHDPASAATVVASQHGEDQGRARQSWCGSGESGDGEHSRKTARSSPKTRRNPGTGATAPMPSLEREKVDVPHQDLEARRSLPGVREGQCLRAEGAEGAGADRGTGAVGGHGLLAGTVALRSLRAGLHGRKNRKAWARRSTTKRRRR